MCVVCVYSHTLFIHEREKSRMQRVKLSYAKSNTDKPIDTQSYNGEKDLTCYECGGALSYKRGHNRTKKEDGVTYPVRAHFFHRGESTCSGESVQHLLAKDIVANQTRFDFYHQCVTCNQESLVMFGIDIGITKMEYRWRDPNNTLFFPDVACLNESGKIQGAIEIHHTHPIPTEKIQAFNNAHITWVEVDAAHIIEQFEAKKTVALVQRCSFKAGNQCGVCEEKEKAKNERLVRVASIKREQAKRRAEEDDARAHESMIIADEKPVSVVREQTESLKPLYCDRCKRYYNQFSHTNIFGGFCFDCDCDRAHDAYVASLRKDTFVKK